MDKRIETYAAVGKDRLGIRFYFHAESQSDADDKVVKWNRYHGFRNSPGYGWHIAIKGDAPDASWIHDEYIS